MHGTGLRRGKPFVLCAAAAALLVCGCDGSGGGGVEPLPGSIYGTFTYGGSETGTHSLTVAVMTDLMDPGSVVVMAGYAVSDVQLAAGYDYAVADVPPGTYYVSGIWDVNDNLGYDAGVDGVYTYGGTLSPMTVEVTEGTDTSGIDIEVE